MPRDEWHNICTTGSKHRKLFLGPRLMVTHVPLLVLDRMTCSELLTSEIGFVENTAAMGNFPMVMQSLTYSRINYWSRGFSHVY